MAPKNWVEKHCHPKLALFIGEKSASLTLCRYILKVLKRSDTHNSDSHGRDLDSYFLVRN